MIPPSLGTSSSPSSPASPTTAKTFFPARTATAPVASAAIAVACSSASCAVLTAVLQWRVRREDGADAAAAA